MPGVVETIGHKKFINLNWEETSVNTVFSDMCNYLGKDIPENSKRAPNSDTNPDYKGQNTYAYSYYWADWMLTEEPLKEEPVTD